MVRRVASVTGDGLYTDITVSVGDYIQDPKQTSSLCIKSHITEYSLIAGTHPPMSLNNL